MLLPVASLLLALAGPGQLLENPEAQAKLAEAQQAFADEDFDAAAAAVEAAYLIEPEPMLLYPWAQAERSRGDCAAAGITHIARKLMSGLKIATAIHMLRSVFGKTPFFCSSMKLKTRS